MTKQVIVTVSFFMDETTAELFLTTSVERVINTSLNIMQYNNADRHEDWHVNHEDWQECRPVVCNLWNSIRDAIFRQKNAIPENNKYTLRKGEL